tara:strand:- start:34659 stop:35339 length:681 start_codon:yes stop_codon:yes gene_type:complete
MIESKSSQRPSVLAIALDMDGLLFDTERLYWQVGDTILQRRGHRFSSELQQRMMGRIGLSAVQQMIDFHGLDDSPQSILDESDELYGELLASGLQPMPGLHRWIEKLQASGLPFALTTSSRRKFVDVIFAEIPWRDALSFMLTGDDVVNGKPHPEMYNTAASNFAVPSDAMLVLEDSGNGCASAVAAGAQVVAIPSEHTRGQDFTGAVLVADSLTDARLWEMIGAA